MAQQPTVFGLAEAARVAGVSQSTIRRRRSELEALGAVQGPKGWQIPIPALIELGLMSRTTDPDPVTPPDTSQVTPVEDVMTGGRADEMEALRGALAAAEQRAAVAEAIAVERERIIEVQAQALRMLEAPREPAGTPIVTPPETDVVSPDRGAETPPDSETRPVHAERARKRWWDWRRAQ